MQEMQLSYEQLVDLCILCGTDFNTNMRGIGPKKSLAMIRQYGSLDRAIEAQGTVNTKYDFSVLNIAVNREIFAIIPWQSYVLAENDRELSLDIRPWSWNISKQNLADAYGWDRDLFGMRLILERGMRSLHPEIIAQAERISARLAAQKMDEERSKQSTKTRGKPKIKLLPPPPLVNLNIQF